MMAPLLSKTVLNAMLVVSMLGLVVVLMSEHLQLLAKYHGALERRVAGGYNLAMKVMVASRVGAVVYYMALGFNIDNGLAADRLMFAYVIVLLSLILPSLYMLRIQRRSFGRNKEFSSFPRFRECWNKHAFAAFVATSFNALGLTIPWLMSATYPELRLTLVNTSFLFNTIFTIINVFYIENWFAKLADDNNSDIHVFVISVIISRSAAFTLISIIYFLSR